MRTPFLFSALLCLATLALARPLEPEDARSLPHSVIQENLPDSHPVVFYSFAKRLFDEGQRDEAVVWFYAGQIRYRFHLAANPSLPRDGEPALMASLNSTIGRTLNEWAGGSPSTWAASIDKALAWDANHANTTTSKQAHSTVLDDIRKKFADLRDKILAEAEDIRKTRKESGLENR